VAANNLDMMQKGRHVPHNRTKTHCKYGHPFDAENTDVTSLGKRRCRKCNEWGTRVERWPGLVKGRPVWMK
jgi:hypothetical protein